MAFQNSRSFRQCAVWATVVGLCGGGASSANVFDMGPGLTDLETVPVGNLGNAGEWSGESYGGLGPDRVCGAVDYEYRIGKYEVTAGHYCRFLNAVAATDTYGLYDNNMDGHVLGCQITRNGMEGDYTYDFGGRPSGTEVDWANRPVNFVDWGDAARFANWLHNGQPTGPQDLGTTEDGAYYLNGSTTNAQLMAVSRESDWKWAVTSEDEWYKAAYHKNDGTTGNYWQYPTSSDSVPSNALLSPDPGNNANFSEPIGSTYGRTDVGAFENSGSPYGTFDQGGNVSEWMEAILHPALRCLRGGSYDHGPDDMLSAFRDSHFPTTEDWYLGFRVSRTPGPAVPGDANLDGHVTDADYTIWADNYGATAANWGMGDFNLSGEVTEADYTVWADNYGATAGAIPEPITVLALATGGLAMLRQRCKRGPVRAVMESVEASGADGSRKDYCETASLSLPLTEDRR